MLNILPHIRNVKVAFRFGFVIAVVYRNNCVPVREMLHFGELIRKLLPSFAAAPVCVDVILRGILYKVECSVLRPCQLVKAPEENASHEPLTARQPAEYL